MQSNLIYATLTAAAALGLLSPVSAWAHPDLDKLHAHNASHRGGHDSGVSELDRQRAFFSFELMTQAVRRRPTPSQQQYLRLAEQEHRIVGRVPRDGDHGVARLREAAHGRLAEEFVRVSVTWTDEGPRVADTDCILLTRGLTRGLVVVVENRTPGAIDLRAWQAGRPESESVAYTVLPGAKQPVLTDLLADSAGEKLAVLCLADQVGGPPAELPLLIEVQEPAVIRGRLLDGDSGEVFPSRVYALGSDNEYRRGARFADNKTLTEKQLLQFWDTGKFYQLPFFYSDGRYEVTLPPGRAELTLERGFEHEVVARTVDLSPGEVRELDLVSRRFADMQSEGWVSGDTHVHWVINEWDQDLPLDLLSVVQRAEDLRVANNLTLLQRGPTKAFINPQQAPMGTVASHSDDHYHIEMGEEYRNEDLYGHLCFLNLDWIVMPIGTGSIIAGPDALDYPINRTAIEACREQGGISIEAHGLGGNKDVPVNVAHALTDSLDQIEPAEYYRFLECGFRLPLTNGSDHPARVLGCARAYVRVDGDFTYEKWIDGIRNCRTFTTSGPLLTLTVNDAEIGDTIEASSSETLTITATVRSRRAIGTLEIVSNSEVLKSESIDASEGQITVQLPAGQSRWVVARCSPGDNFNALSGPDIAHTSAIYVDVDGKPRFQADEARVWIARMRQHIADINSKGRFANDAQRAEAVQYVEDGIAKFEELIAADAVDPSDWPMAGRVDAQPLVLQTKRLAEALDYIGNPLPQDVVAELEQLASEPDDAKVADRVQALLDPYCVAGVRLRDGEIKAIVPDKTWPLVEKGWRSYLVKVCNDAGLTTRLHVESPNARPLPHAKSEDVASRWMGLTMFDGRPMQASLSGIELEYRIVQFYSRDEGEKQAPIEFSIDAKPGTRGRQIREWRFDEGTDGWEAANQVEAEARDGSLHLEGTGEDAFITAEVGNVTGELLLRFWGEASDDGVVQVFHWTEERPEPDPNRVVTLASIPGAARQYEAAISVEGTLAGVRIDPNTKASSMRIDWVDLSYAHRRGETWTSVPMKFVAERAVPVKIEVIDKHPDAATAAFVVRDKLGRIYPEQSKRLAPDLFFHPQVYRLTGETIKLPPGEYDVEAWRGPESLRERKKLVVTKGPTTLSHEVKRWIDPSELGWWSGDHHIHAAGCLHYQNPTQGIQPRDMIRQIMGEDLHVGCCLTWGPCFDYQKRFFSGKQFDLLRYPYLVRYDVEVSGFGSHASGHLNLLRLTEQIYPGGTSKDHWPTLGLNTLRWAKAQDAVCGTAHSAAGLTRYVDDLGIPAGPKGVPHYNIPAFDSIGANEFIMNVTHQLPGPDGRLVPAIDFLATMNTPRVEELSIWYHTLNCGYRVRASGETDFPCMSGERVGIGRVYVKLEDRLNFPEWVQGIQDGRSYVSDAKAHLIDFECKSPDGRRVEVGVDGSELAVEGPTGLQFSADVAALLEQSDYQSADAPELEVELIVNGLPVATSQLKADGSRQPFAFEATIERSSWVALRVFPHAHTNPIFIVVDGKPIRASKASAEWCLRGVDQCWRMKVPTYATEEQADAHAAYEHARKEFARIRQEATE
ncbi:MAG: CehA/McbA family metallohydrolase [Planctomycetota bacterium]